MIEIDHKLITYKVTYTKSMLQCASIKLNCLFNGFYGLCFILVTSVHVLFYTVQKEISDLENVENFVYFFFIV